MQPVVGKVRREYLLRFLKAPARLFHQPRYLPDELPGLLQFFDGRADAFCLDRIVPQVTDPLPPPVFAPAQLEKRSNSAIPALTEFARDKSLSRQRPEIGLR